MAANNSKRKQLEKRLADAEKYLKEYKSGNHSVVVSNLTSNKIERNIKKLKEQLASMSTLPEITVTAKKVPTKTTGSGAAAVVPPKKKPYVPASKKPKQGNIGRTTTKYDTPKGKAKVAAKPKETKRKVGTSGMEMKAYQNLNFNRRK